MVDHAERGLLNSRHSFFSLHWTTNCDSIPSHLPLLAPFAPINIPYGKTLGKCLAYRDE